MLTLVIVAVFVILVISVFYVILQNVRSQKRYQAVEFEIKNGQLNEAATHLQSIVNDYPEDLNSLYNLAELQIKTENYFDGVQNAKALLQKELKKYGISPINLRLLIAEGTLAMGNKNEAQSYYHEAIKLDPTNPLINRKLAIFEYENGNFEKAQSYAENVLNFYPEDPEANLYAGISAYQLENYTLAAKTLAITIQNDPHNFQAAFTLAKINAKDSDKNIRDKYFKQALSCTQDQEQLAQLHLLWATTELKLNHLKIALEHHELGLRLTNDINLKKNILREMIALFEKEKNISKTIWAMKDFLKLEPENKGYRSKIEYYLELDANTKLQKYEMLNGEEFAEFCKTICATITPIDTIIDVNINADSSVDILCSKETKPRKRNIQFRFIRSNTKIGKLFARDLYEKMRANKGEKAYIVANTDYTEDAGEFSHTREIVLINKTKLLKYLDELGDD